MNPGSLIASFVLPILLVVIVLLVLGGLAAWLITSLIQPTRKKPPGSQKGDLVEVFRLHRERNSKAICLETGGRIYRSRSEMTVNQADQLSILLGELLVWLGKPDLVQRAVEVQGSATPPQPVLAAEPALLTPVGGAKSRSRLLNPLDALVEAVATDVPQRTVAQKSIAVLIDEILQTKLAEIGMEELKIRLVELPEGGVAVAVGLEQYNSVEDIPDEPIRRLIRASVAQWEQQSPA